MLTRNIAALIFTLASFALLFPGLTNPILEITVSADLPIIGKTTFYEQTQSILETVKNLWAHNNEFVAVLIFLFSVIVPVTKGVILLVVLLVRDFGLKLRMFRVVQLIGKWSMADVFVVGVFMSFLSSQSNSSVEAQLHSGFYYFAGYCLISMVGIQVAKLPLSKEGVS
ncbi:hypothetical protein BFP72_05020 [Reichenbachiella sp. 5M10]|uniref:paraquat-inducible protein A n=1 Tax=Reichenbachiella sp. 5M10 TaxID=1889772 RepID=UPI000C144791|nr:paraquat-inducible protein A [Reichenbachiella sp. 5M10]PIB34810.1 hypothetical protein BFP72_05020 [Reichenbachiella sp. 5M10]